MIIFISISIYLTKLTLKREDNCNGVILEPNLFIFHYHKFLYTSISTNFAINKQFIIAIVILILKI